MTTMVLSGPEVGRGQIRRGVRAWLAIAIFAVGALIAHFLWMEPRAAHRRACEHRRAVLERIELRRGVLLCDRGVCVAVPADSPEAVRAQRLERAREQALYLHHHHR